MRSRPAHATWPWPRHDAPLATEAVSRLRRADRSCGLELLYGLPMRRSLELADWLAMGVHVYVPYGKAYLPYALGRMRATRASPGGCCATWSLGLRQKKSTEPAGELVSH